MIKYAKNPERNKIIKNNLIIAQLMGYTKDYYDHGINGEQEIWRDPDLKDRWKTPSEFEYHFNWNSLIPVIKKIEHIISGDEVLFYELGDIWNESVDNKWEELISPFSFEDFPAIKDVWKAVIDFAKWQLPYFNK